MSPGTRAVRPYTDRQGKICLGGQCWMTHSLIAIRCLDTMRSVRAFSYVWRAVFFFNIIFIFFFIFQNLFISRAGYSFSFSTPSVCTSSTLHTVWWRHVSFGTRIINVRNTTTRALYAAAERLECSSSPRVNLVRPARSLRDRVYSDGSPTVAKFARRRKSSTPSDQAFAHAQQHYARTFATVDVIAKPYRSRDIDIAR